MIENLAGVERALRAQAVDRSSTPARRDPTTAPTSGPVAGAPFWVRRLTVATGVLHLSPYGRSPRSATDPDRRRRRLRLTPSGDVGRADHDRVIVVAIVVRVVLHFVIRRVVDQVVNGVKRKQNVDDTQALRRRRSQAVRVVQRTRTLGSVLNNVVDRSSSSPLRCILDPRRDRRRTSTGASRSSRPRSAPASASARRTSSKTCSTASSWSAKTSSASAMSSTSGPATGVVEAVGIRVTQVRDVNGTLWFVRNGEILRVGNLSQGWARVIIDLAVPYDADVDAVQDAMLETRRASSPRDPKWKHAHHRAARDLGHRVGLAEAVVIRLVVKTRSADQGRRRPRAARRGSRRPSTTMGVKLPVAEHVVLTGFEGAASVQGARRPQRTVPDAASVPRGRAPDRASRRMTSRDPDAGAADGLERRASTPIPVTLRIGRRAATPRRATSGQQVGGRPTFEKLVRALLRGRRAPTRCCWPMYPEQPTSRARSSG